MPSGSKKSRDTARDPNNYSIRVNDYEDREDIWDSWCDESWEVWGDYELYEGNALDCVEEPDADFFSFGSEIVALKEKR